MAIEPFYLKRSVCSKEVQQKNQWNSGLGVAEGLSLLI